MNKQIYSFKSFIISLFVSIGIGKAVNGQQCSVVYQATPNIAGGGNLTYRYIRTLNTANGTGGTIIYNGATGPCYSALTGTPLANGSILTNTAALAYAPNTNRIYFVNNSTTAEDLCYIDLNTSPVRAIRYVGYPLETATGNGYNINRMTFAADGYGYALSNNANHLIRFSTGKKTVVEDMGSLIDAGSNKEISIHNKNNSWGGDMVADAFGKLYIISASHNVFALDADSRIATHLGTIKGLPGTYTTNGAAVSDDDNSSPLSCWTEQEIQRTGLNLLRRF